MLIALVFLATLVIGVPIAFVLGLVGSVHLVTLNPALMIQLPQRIFITAGNYSLLAIPLFILAGDLMDLSGDVERLMAFAKACVGKIKGGLAYVMIILGFLLGGPLGSANAEAALLSSTMFPEMKKEGYNETFIAGLIASISVCGPLIPPGMLMIVYGVASGASIKDLFLAGIMPGVYLAIALAIAVILVSRNFSWPQTSFQGWGHVWYTFKRASLSIGAPIVVLLSIALGIATATEAAAVASMLTLLIGTFIYRKIKIKDLIPVFLKAGVLSGSILIISSMGGVFGWTLALDQVPQKAASLVLSITNNPYFILLLINIFVLIVGMFMDATPAVMILVPVFMPLVRQVGYDPVHFGLMICFNLTLGLLTPPVGTVLYTTALSTGVPINRLFKSIWTWVSVCVIVLLFVTYVPESIMFIPHMFSK